jgi:hypothetical protein
MADNIVHLGWVLIRRSMPKGNPPLFPAVLQQPPPDESVKKKLLTTGFGIISDFSGMAMAIPK